MKCAIRKAHRAWMWGLVLGVGLVLAGCSGSGNTTSNAPAGPTQISAATPTAVVSTATATTTLLPPIPTSPPVSTATPANTPTVEVAQTEASATVEISFAADVQPILTERCVKCHSGANPPRGLQLDNYEHVLAGGTHRPVIIPGNTEESELIKRIKGISIPRMPFDGPPYLSDEQIATIEAWIAAGAPDN